MVEKNIMFVISIWFCLYFIFALWVFVKLASNKKHKTKAKNPNRNQPHVNVIIPFRNEKCSLPNILNSIVHTNYSNVTWVFVNDHSEDQGAGYLLESNIPNLVLINNTGEGKKQALITGLLFKPADIYILMDADVQFHAGYVNQITADLHSGVDAIVGRVQMTSGKINYLTIVQSTEWEVLQRITHFFTLLNNPILSNNANFAFKGIHQSIAIQALKEMKTTSGDDLAILQVFKSNKLKIHFSSNLAAVTITPLTNFHDFLQQRVRWMKKTPEMASTASLVGLIMMGTNILLIVSVFYLDIAAFLSLTVFKLIADLLLLSKINIRAILAWPFIQVYPLVFWLLHPFVKLTWKGRIIKK